MRKSPTAGVRTKLKTVAFRMWGLLASSYKKNLKVMVSGVVGSGVDYRFDPLQLSVTMGNPVILKLQN